MRWIRKAWERFNAATTQEPEATEQPIKLELPPGPPLKFSPNMVARVTADQMDALRYVAEFEYHNHAWKMERLRQLHAPISITYPLELPEDLRRNVLRAHLYRQINLGLPVSTGPRTIAVTVELPSELVFTPQQVSIELASMRLLGEIDESVVVQKEPTHE